MTNEESIHDTVSAAYASALERTRGGACPTTATLVSGLTDLAGYREERGRHAEAAASSFGCGHPLSFASVGEGDTVLDLGCGAGLDLLIAAEKVGPTGKVIGVDMTTAMVEEARAHAEGAGFADRVEVREGLIEELPVEDGCVDHVISNCVINLSPDKERVFAELARVLAAGGRFAISDLVVERLPSWIRMVPQAYAACVSGAIGEEAYLAGLRAAGLEDVTVIDRLVYTVEQIEALGGELLERVPVPRMVVRMGLKSVAGQVWSARITGRRP
ncbi:MAG: methyltransferase domain-containing protein [Planctomycetota bacterium]|jgi:SAM-dependent methyltransferase|nr:methyltransferase domain-containing protein [Planctomycetota bacterium]MDP6763220.1 methyltransferase domain-containing protein [Planctomycetota bacterium]MDP6990571.1 methyltransferase domain-containing protein [Planctomycetota bacterium]